MTEHGGRARRWGRVLICTVVGHYPYTRVLREGQPWIVASPHRCGRCERRLSGGVA